MPLILEKERYNVSTHPTEGKHIIGQVKHNLIVVYQAYKLSTSNHTVKHQKLGGPEYSFNRMSWIKPNFLWMMYRSGWAQKEGQERVLAFWIETRFFDEILEESVASGFDATYYGSVEEWKLDLERREVRLQWDPDHDPFGNALSRRAVQLGLKGRMLKRFANEEIRYVEDITPFVHEQFRYVSEHCLDSLHVPVERPYVPSSLSISKKIGLNF